MNDEPTLRAEIALVEDRLAQRRQRAAAHLEQASMRVEEARDRVRRVAGWLPIVGITAIVATGLVLGGRRRVVPATSAVGAGALGTLLALGGAALRIAQSPPAQAIWRAMRSRNGMGQRLAGR